MLPHPLPGPMSAPTCLPDAQRQLLPVDQEVLRGHVELRDELLHVAGAAEHRLPGVRHGVEQAVGGVEAASLRVGWQAGGQREASGT